MTTIFETKAIEYEQSTNDWEYLTVDGLPYRADIECDQDDNEYTYVIYYQTDKANEAKRRGWHYCVTVKNGQVVDVDDHSDDPNGY
jgi:hypothetical protein